MAKERYIEKSTGKWWYLCGCSSMNGVKEMHICDWNDSKNRIKVKESDFEEQFEYKPFDAPSVVIEPVIARHPIRIVLRCPVCGSELKVKGGAILSSPLQYENVCSNPDCNYGGICTSTYYSGMYAAVTDKQESAITNMTYNEHVHGTIITLHEKDLWKFND